jgi:hypothetical protein
LNEKDAMAGKPFRSILIPYLDEIATLRGQRPPVSYARIADILREKYGLNVKRAAIGKFVKLRSGGRKVYFFRQDPAAKTSKPAHIASVQHAGPRQEVHAFPKPKPQASDDDFGFTYSDHYNLTRLPPEEAAVRRKKLEEEGH